MDRLVVNGTRIEEYIDIVTKKINEFIELIHEISDSKKKIVWECENANILYEKYDNMIKDYFSYSERMIKFMDYLNRTINRYDESLVEIKKEYTKLKNEYDEVKR